MTNKPLSVRILCVCISLAAVLLSLAGTSAVAQVGGGIANTMEIDGNLIANNPAGTNDWLDGPMACVMGTGGILSNAPPGGAKPLFDPFLFVRLAQDSTNGDPVFKTKSNKVSDNPNTYNWSIANSPPKNDIGQAGIALSTEEVGGTNHLWAAMFGDTSSVNGDSYMDFEFLQASLVRTDTNKNTGGFMSVGPHGGRTLGDLLLTIHLVNGGSRPNFFSQVWTETASNKFAYVDTPVPPGSAFVSANSNTFASVCFGAFGSTNYLFNQFGEAGANLTAILANVRTNPCFGVATLFIRTKSSASPTAELKDFIEPISVGVGLDTIPPSILCPADTNVSCFAQVPVANTNAVVASDNCALARVQLINVTTNGTCPTTITRTYRATDTSGNSATCTQTITVNDTTPPVLSGCPPVSTNVQCITQVPAAPTVTANDNCDGAITPSFSQMATNPGSSCSNVITRTWTATDSCGNSASCTQTITVNDTTAPTITCPSALTVACLRDIPAANTNAVTVSDNCGGITVTACDSGVTGTNCGGTVTRTYRATDACGNFAECTQLFTINVCTNLPPCP